MRSIVIILVTMGLGALFLCTVMWSAYGVIAALLTGLVYAIVTAFMIAWANRRLRAHKASVAAVQEMGWLDNLPKP